MTMATVQLSWRHPESMGVDKSELRRTQDDCTQFFDGIVIFQPIQSTVRFSSKADDAHRLDNHAPMVGILISPDSHQGRESGYTVILTSLMYDSPYLELP